MGNQLYDKIYGKPTPEQPYYDCLYARGFLIADREYTVLDHWKRMYFGCGLYITYDPDNPCVYVEQNDAWTLILGTVMDMIDWHMDSGIVARKVVQLYQKGENALYDYLDELGGRHLIVYGDKEHAYLVQDATGMRSLCYYRHELLAASHYQIIAGITGAERLEFVREYVERKPLPWLLPGNCTPFVDVMAMMPNHRLELHGMRLKRIFPRGPRLNADVNEVMDYIADCCKKQMDVLTADRKLIFSLTRGNDARITLAALGGKTDGHIFYTYHARGDQAQEVDYIFTKAFCKEHQMEFVEIPMDGKAVQDEFDKLSPVCYHNHYHQHVFRAIPGVRAHLPKGRLAVRSNLVEIIRSDFYSDLPQYCDWEKVARRLSYPDKMDDEWYRSTMKRFYDEHEFGNIYDYHTGDLIYWEYRMGLWMNSAVLLKDDTCFDTYMLFNQRKLLQYGLGIPRYFKKMDTVVHEVIRRLQPKLLYDIPNTEYTLMDYYLPDSRTMIELGGGTMTGMSAQKEAIPVYLSAGRFQAVCSFGSSKIRKGDLYKYRIPFRIEHSGVYAVQITVFVPSILQKASSFAWFEVLLCGKLCYKQNLLDYANKDNQINIVTKLDPGEKSITFVMHSKTDYDAGSHEPGVLLIRSITASRQFNYEEPEEPIVMTTSQMYAQKVKKK